MAGEGGGIMTGGVRGGGLDRGDRVKAIRLCYKIKAWE